METQQLIRHFQAEWIRESSHLTVLGRVFFYVLTNILLVVVSCTINRRSYEVTEKYRIYTLPKVGALFVLSCVYLAVTLLISTYAVFQDAWTLKQWVLYTMTCIFGALAHILYASTYKLGLKSLAGSALAGFVTLIFNQWLFIALMEMDQTYHNKATQWKLILRICQGLRTVFTLFHTCQLVSQVLVHLFGLSHSKQINFFWKVSLLLLITFIIVNILLFGPFLHVLGFIIGAIMYSIPAIKHSLTYLDDQALKQ